METYRFVARQAQLGELDRFLNESLSSHGQVAFVVGEAGSGKTALLAEFARRAETAHKNLVIGVGNCNAQTGIGDPYLPFREILAQFTGDFDTRLAKVTITKENARRLRGLVRWSCDALMEFGPDLINLLVPGTTLIAKAGKFVIEQSGGPDKLKKLVERKTAVQQSSSVDQSHIFEQYTRVLKALASKRPLVLILDDLQWADNASISLLFHLGRRIDDSRILLLGAYRPEEVELGRGSERHPLDKVLAEYKRYFGDIWVDLNQVEKTEARQFVDALLDLEPNHLGPSFRQALVRHTGGHPLFAVELLRSMQEQGDLLVDADACWVEGSKLDWDDLPPKVEGVIEERIDRLEAELKDILTVGSVEGELFTAEVIAHVRAVDDRHIIRRLSNELDRQHHLVTSQGIKQIDNHLLSSYCFRHNLFQKYLNNNLDIVEKTYLHKDVGNALEMLYCDQTEQIAVQLAWHFQEAAITEKAVKYLIQAGEQARHRYANAEAIVYFRRALALITGKLPDPHRQIIVTDLLENLGDLLFLTGEVDQAKTTYQDALDWAPDKNYVWLSRLHRKIGKTWDRLRYFHKEALKAYDLAETILKEEPGNPTVDWWQEWIAIQIDRIWTYYWSKGNWRDMYELAEKAQLAVQQYGTSAQRSSFYECLVLVDNRRYRYVVPDETLANAQTSLEASQEAGDLAQIAHSQFQLGFCHLWRRELDQAKDMLLAALAIAERIGEADIKLMCLTFLPVVYRKNGQVEETNRLLKPSLEEARTKGSVEYEGMAKANMAWVALRQGNLSEAQLNSQAALDLWQPPTIILFKSLALWPLIGVRIAHSELAGAIDLMRALMAADQQPLPDRLESFVGKAIAAWESGDIELVHANLDQATHVAKELGYI